ncbi:MAG: N-acetylmuramoyl-L-alanine amidase [Candidatus Krumholzibacteriia bacterium]
MRPAWRESQLAGVVALTLLGTCAGLCRPAPAGAAAVRGPVVRQVRTWTAPDHTRVVLDLSGPVDYEVRRVAGPDRVAVNIAGARFASTSALKVGDGIVAQVRRNVLRGRAQVVIDLEGAGEIRHFRLPAANGRPHRIVVDLSRPVAAVPPPGAATAGAAPDSAGAALVVVADPGAAEAAATVDAAAAPAANGPPAGGADPAAAAESSEGAGNPVVVGVGASAVGAGTEAATARPFTVIIDPGHGGMDPGAIREGVQEKDITVEVARELARQIAAIPGCRAVLTRDGDYFVSLADRVRIARRERGDVFVSLHCNTHPRTSTDGMEVYFLSLQGATDREAQELADEENAADLVGLAPDEARDDSVLSILMDLRMARVLDQSSQLAEAILRTARGSNLIGARKVKQARFQVLRSLAMPSALVEMAYLSNPGDRTVLNVTAGRRRLAGLVADGVLSWRGGGAPAAGGAASLAATGDEWRRRYRVRRGDTLWELARRHGTTIAEICRRNGLPAARITVGQSLRLPVAN